MQKLSELSIEERYNYLRLRVYENIKERRSGILYISTYYLKKLAEMLGGNYNNLSITGKIIFKDDIVSERIFPENGFEKYTKL